MSVEQRDAPRSAGARQPALPSLEPEHVEGEYDRHSSRAEAGVADIGTGSSPNTGAPYLRLASQATRSHEFTSAAYVRLGGCASDETGLLPSIAGSATSAGIPTSPQVTTSAATPHNYGSSEAYAAAQNPGSPTSLEQVVTVTVSSPLTPSGAGPLLYAHDDLLMKTGGSAFVQYGGGQGTVVLGGDSETDLPAGQYRLSALNGVAITGGTSTAPADIVLTAYNAVSLTSLGPSDSVTYGNSSSETHGDSHSVTWGDGYSEVHGTTTSLFYGASRSWAFDNDVTGKFADSLLLLVGTTTSIVLGASISVVIGNMSYVYLLSYAELYLGAFVSFKKGPVILVKDFETEASGILVRWHQARVASAQADVQSTEVNLPTAGVEIGATEVQVEQSEVVTRSRSVAVDMSELEVHM